MIARLRPVPVLLVLAASLVLGACATPAAPPTPAPVTPVPSTMPTAAPTVTPTEAPAFPATLTDDEGTEVVIAAEPAKIVSLTPAATETLFALGVGDRVVGKV